MQQGNALPLMVLLLLLLAHWMQKAALHSAAGCSAAAGPAGSPLAAQGEALSSAPGRCPALRAASVPLAWGAARGEHASPSCLAALQGPACVRIPHHSPGPLNDYQPWQNDLEAVQQQEEFEAESRGDPTYLCLRCLPRTCCSSCVEQQLTLGGDLRGNGHEFLHSNSDAVIT